ncbi:MAG: acyltransferase family protein [Erysipelotrichaceae bacterium]|nr:acyltransferase family protein [Erysipelotrichaceae bacterium]
MSSKPKERYPYIDIARGICLILVVWAHAKGPHSAYIYLFHMPFFFFLSGYLHNTETEWKGFIQKRVKNYYIPFVFWNTVVTAGRFVFGNMKIGTALRQVFWVLLAVEKDGKVMGATWFLGALFLVSAIYKLLETATKRTGQHHLILCVFFVLAAVGAYYHKLPHMQSRTVILAAFYAAGVLSRRLGFDPEKHCDPRAMLLAFALFLWLRQGMHVNMGTNVYRTMPKFILTSLLGTYIVLSLSVFLTKWFNVFTENIGALLGFIGRRGIDLVIWQFVAFWVITTFQQFLKNGSFVEFMKGDAVQTTSGGWWFLYFLAGMILPLLWTDLLRKGRLGAFLKKYHIV